MKEARAAGCRRIVVIGQFGDPGRAADGQSIKTWNFFRLLSDSGLFERVGKVDTLNAQRKPIRLLFATFRSLAASDVIVLMVSRRGKGFYYPFLHFWSKLFKVDVFQNVIGGTLPVLIGVHPRWVGHLNSFRVNWVETPGMVNDLRDSGVLNANYLPNFKQYVRFEPRTGYASATGLARFCLFSRVSRSKGIIEAVHAVEALNRMDNSMVASLDIYGAVQPDFAEEFDQLMTLSSGAVRYCGSVDAARAPEILRDYYMLLFPTSHPGEGMPGTLLDALAAGLPAIASEWRYNGEIIHHGVEGILYDPVDPDGLVLSMRWALANPDRVNDMRAACLVASEQYSPSAVLKQVIRDMEAL